jgi:ribosome-associated protein
MVSDVAIRGAMIRLGQLLKVAGLIDSGAQVKAFLADHEVRVNGVREDRRGRQLHPGDVVTVEAEELHVISRGASEHEEPIP